MDHVERLAQALERDDERNVSFRRALSAGDHIDAVAPQRTEKPSRDAGRMLHVLAHDRDRGQIGLLLDPVDLSHGDFLSELGREHLDRHRSVGVADADRRRILGSRLRDEEHADARLGQRLEYPVIDADHANHAQSLNRNQAGIVDRRNPLDCPAGVLHMLARDERAGRIEIERILDDDRNIPVVGGENRRRIDHLRAEIAQLHRLDIAQTLDHVGVVDHFRVGGHEAVDVGPDFEHRGVEGRGENRRRIVRPPAAEIRSVPARQIARDEAGHDHRARHLPERLTDQLLGRCEIDDMPPEIGLRLDEPARIVTDRSGKCSANDHR